MQKRKLPIRYDKYRHLTAYLYPCFHTSCSILPLRLFDLLDEAKTKKMKKRKKKDKKAKEKKKWWDFGSSSSSDSSEEDDVSKEMKKSSEDIKVRMKSTSSEDDKNEVYSERERTSIVEEELGIGEKSKEDVVRMANDLLKEMPDVYGGEKILFGVFDKSGDKDPMEIRQRYCMMECSAQTFFNVLLC